jgi:DNA-binding NarL/FixJ family response regulator
LTSLIRVLIADDHSLVRAGFQSVLSIEDDITVVGEARNGAEAVALARDEVPDVVLMDIRMPELDGLEATRLITSDPRLRRTRVVVLTTFDLDEYVCGALRAGASGFLLKGAEPPVLIEAVDARDRTQLVVIAYESGLIVPGQPHTRGVLPAD